MVEKLKKWCFKEKIKNPFFANFDRTEPKKKKSKYDFF